MTTDTNSKKKLSTQQILLNENKKIILMPGRLTSWKGQELFLEAINLVNIQLGYEAFNVVILGNDQGRDLYKKKLRVYFLKFLRKDRKFKNPVQLIRQMNKDVIFVKKGLKLKLVL